MGEKMKKVAFYTLGCKVNQYETNAMMQKLQQAGYEIVDFEEKADIYIINTYISCFNSFIYVLVSC